MAAVPQRDSAPEIKLRKELHKRGYRYRLHAGELPGRPDFILPRLRAAVFVNGCYWHRHQGCRLTTTPRANHEFWLGKFKANVDRDLRNYQLLKELGWNVIIVWECEIKASVGDAASRVEAELAHLDQLRDSI